MKKWKYATEQVGRDGTVELPDDAVVVCAFEDDDNPGEGEILSYIAYLTPVKERKV